MTTSSHLTHSPGKDFGWFVVEFLHEGVFLSTNQPFRTVDGPYTTKAQADESRAAFQAKNDAAFDRKPVAA